jgi:hypothetical protein
MPIFSPGTPLRRGDPLTAERLNAIEAELIRLGAVRGGPGVDVRQGKGGLHITGVRQADRYLAKATSNFAVTSGTTPTSGSVDLYWRNPGSGAMETSGTSLAEVWNMSDFAMTSGNAIDSGMWCSVWQDCFGTWWISPESCA